MSKLNSTSRFSNLVSGKTQSRFRALLAPKQQQVSGIDEVNVFMPDVAEEPDMAGVPQSLQEAASIAPQMEITPTGEITQATGERLPGGLTDEDRAKAFATLVTAEEQDIPVTEAQKSLELKGTPGGRIVSSIVSGAAGIPSGLLGAAEAVGIEGAGKVAKNIDEWISEIAPSDPNFVEKLSSGVGSAAVFIPFGFGVGSVAKAISTISPKVASWFGASASALLESATEAGALFNETGDREAATKSFLANALLIGITNKFGIFSEKAKREISKGLLNASLEGLQEAGQSLIESGAKGEDPNWNDVIESAGIGAIIGSAVPSAATEEKAAKQAEKPAPEILKEEELPIAEGEEVKSEAEKATEEKISPEIPAEIKQTGITQEEFLSADPKSQFIVKQTSDKVEEALKGKEKIDPKTITDVVNDVFGKTNIAKLEELYKKVEAHNKAIEPKVEKKEVVPEVAPEVVTEKAEEVKPEVKGTPEQLFEQGLSANEVIEKLGAKTANEQSVIISRERQFLKEKAKEITPEAKEEQKAKLIDDFFETRDYRATKGNKNRTSYNNLLKVGEDLRKIGINAKVENEKLYIDNKVVTKPKVKVEKEDIATYKNYKPKSKPEEIETMAEYIAFHSENFPVGFGKTKIDQGIADIKNGVESNEAKVVQSVTDDFIDEINKSGDVEVPFTPTKTARLTVAEFREEVQLRKLAKKEGVINAEITETINRPAEEIESFAEDIISKAESEDEAELQKAADELEAFFKSKIAKPTVEKTPAGEQLTFGKEVKPSFPTKAKFVGEVDKSEETPLFEQKKEDKGQELLFQKAEIDAIEFSEELNPMTERKEQFIQIKDVNKISNKTWEAVAKVLRREDYDVDVEFLRDKFDKGFTNGKTRIPHYVNAIKEVFGKGKVTLKENNAKLFEASKKAFGTTENTSEAGYILPDGAMLDFSGKIEGGTPGQRAYDHRQITSQLDDFGFETDMQDFIDKGAIRYMPESDMFDLNNNPTARQKAQMREIIENADGEVIVEAGEGLDRLYKEYDKGTEAREIFNDIDIHFRGKQKGIIASLKSKGLYQKAPQKLSQLSKEELDAELGLVNKLLPEDVTVALDNKIVDKDGNPVRASVDIAKKIIKVNPDLADLTSIPHEIAHAGISLVEPERARTLLKRQGWDGKGEITDFSNESLVAAHEKIAEGYELYFNDNERFKQEFKKSEQKPLARLYERLKSLFTKISSWYKSRGLTEEAKFYKDLSEGKLKENIFDYAQVEFAQKVESGKDNIASVLKEKFSNLEISVFEKYNEIILSKVIVPKEQRGEGIGTDFMNTLIEYSDKTGKRVVLTPSKDFGGGLQRLKKFYKGFGFVENIGKNRDFTTKESFIREPNILYQKAKKPSEKILKEDKIDNLGLRKADAEDLRDLIGLGKVNEGEYEARAEVVYDVIKNNLQKDARLLAKDIIENPRGLTSTEFVALVVRGREIKSELAEVTDVNSRRFEWLQEELDDITRATDLAGRKQAQGFGIRQIRLEKDFTLSSNLTAARKSKGSRLTPEEKKKLEDLSEKLRKSEERRKLEYDNYVKELEKKDKQLAERVAKVESKISKKRQTKIEVIDARISATKDRLRALGLRVNDVFGLTAEGYYEVGLLATDYIKRAVELTGENADLKQIVKQIQGDLPDLTESDIYKALNTKRPSVQAKAKTEAQKQVELIKRQARWETKVAEAERGIFEKRITAETPAKIKDLQSKYNELRKLAYQTINDSAKLSRALKTLDRLQGMVDNHYRDIKKKRTPDPLNLADIKKEANKLRRQMRVEDTLADLQEQLRTGEFKVKEKVKTEIYPEDLNKADIEVRRIRKAIEQAIRELKPKSAAKKVVRVMEIGRTMKASMDVSAALRQAYLAMPSNPIKFAKNFYKSLGSFVSEEKYETTQREIENHPNQFIREAAGLQINDINSVPGSEEYMAGSEILEKIPVYGKGISASNRNMTTMLNLTRSTMFDNFLELYPNATMDELKTWARYVNITTGVGDLGKFKAAADPLGFLFFAPKFAVSRIQYPYQIVKNWSEPRVRKEVAKNQIKNVALVSMIISLALMAGLEVGLDPDDSDFLKIKVGNTRVDIGAGLIQPIRVTTNIISGGSKDPLRDIGRYGSYKLAPSVTVPLALYTGKNIIGQEQTALETIGSGMLPMVIEDVSDAYEDSGLARSAWVAPLVLSGAGVSTYKRRKEPTGIEKEVKELDKQFRELKEEKNTEGYRELAKTDFARWLEREQKVMVDGKETSKTNRQIINDILKLDKMYDELPTEEQKLVDQAKEDLDKSREKLSKVRLHPRLRRILTKANMEKLKENKRYKK